MIYFDKNANKETIETGQVYFLNPFLFRKIFENPKFLISQKRDFSCHLIQHYYEPSGYKFLFTYV